MEIETTPLPLSDTDGISLLAEEDGLPVDDKFPVLSLDCAVHLAVGGIIQEHIDHVVEVNGRVTDGNSIHFAGTEGSPGNQAPSSAQSFTPTFTIMCLRGDWHYTKRLEWKVGKQRASLDSHSFYHLSFILGPSGYS